MQFLYGSLPVLMAPTGAAEGQAGGPASILPTLITFGLVFLIFYFLIIRPQNKKQKETKQMLASLDKGDRVVTIGGIRGVIQSMKEDSVVIKVDDKVTMEFSKSAVSNVLEKKGSGKSKTKGESSSKVEDKSEAKDEAAESTDSSSDDE
jgi:preprotein translocase subunit YajC